MNINNNINNNINKYEELKDKILNSYNNTYNLIGGIQGDITKKIFDGINNIKDLKVFNGTDHLYQNLQTYKQNLQALLDKTNEKIKSGNEIKDIFMKNGDSVKEIEKLFDIKQPKSLGSYLEKYKNYLQKYKFQNEFLKETNGDEIIDNTNPERDLLIVDFNESADQDSNFNEFNINLLKIFYPYISNLQEILDKKSTEDKRIELKKNIDKELERIIELTNLSKQYEVILIDKKKSFDKIINTEYNISNIKFIINPDLDENNFKDDLKEKKILQENEIDIDNVNIINKMIESVSNILQIKDNINELTNLNLNINDIQDDLDYVELKPKENWKYIEQMGGVIEFTEKYIIDVNTDKKLVQFIKLLEKLFNTIFVTINLSQELKQLQLRYNYYVAYIFGIIKEESSTSNRRIYKYINKNIIDKYLTIIKKIISNFDTNLKNPVIEYFNKYHYYTLQKLDDFLTFILSNYDINKIIDIDKCTGDIEISFIIFNHFKDLLDKPEVNFLA